MGKLLREGVDGQRIVMGFPDLGDSTLSWTELRWAEKGHVKEAIFMWYAQLRPLDFSRSYL